MGINYQSCWSASIGRAHPIVTQRYSQNWNISHRRTQICANSVDISQEVHTLKPGDVVSGVVKGVQPHGAAVQLATTEGLEGFMPTEEAPVYLERHGKGRVNLKDILGPGTEREFIVLDAPEEGTTGKKEVVLSARSFDSNILWERMEQMKDISTEGCENFTVFITGANNGGLTANLGGIPVFIPVSQLERKADKTWWTAEEMSASFVGKKLSVAILDVSLPNKKVVCSAVKAKENEGLRRLEVGALIVGKVRRIEPFGVFVGISGTRISGLLHISNISRRHVDDPGTIFKVGEEISCLIMALEDDFSNISLSTAELEPNDGDILEDKAAVWAQAAEQSEAFMKQLRGTPT